MGDASSFSSLSSSSSSDMGEWEESSSLVVGQRPSAYSSPSCVVSNPRRRKGNSGLGLAELLRDDDEPRHFLDACFLCKKSIGRNRDVFMYRGDTPFCSEECRQEQIEKDEAAERMQKRSLKVKATASKKKNAQKKAGSSTPNDHQFFAGTTVAG